MPLGITIIKRSVVGAGKIVCAEIDFDSSYPTGGESLTKGDLGFDHQVDLLLAEPKSGYSFEYDRSGALLIVRVPALVGGAAGAVTTDDHPLTGVGADTTKSIQYGPAGAATVRLGPQKEIASAVDLSTLVDVRIMAFGDFPYA